MCWHFFFYREMFCSQCKSINELMNECAHSCFSSCSVLRLKSSWWRSADITVIPPQTDTHTPRLTHTQPRRLSLLRGSFYLDLPWAHRRDTVNTQQRRRKQLPVLGRRALSFPSISHFLGNGNPGSALAKGLNHTETRRERRGVEVKLTSWSERE